MTFTRLQKGWRANRPTNGDEGEDEDMHVLYILYCICGIYVYLSVGYVCKAVLQNVTVYRCQPVIATIEGEDDL